MWSMHLYRLRSVSWRCPLNTQRTGVDLQEINVALETDPRSGSVRSDLPGIARWCPPRRSVRSARVSVLGQPTLFDGRTGPASAISRAHGLGGHHVRRRMADDTEATLR